MKKHTITKKEAERMCRMIDTTDFRRGAYGVCYAFREVFGLQYGLVDELPELPDRPFSIFSWPCTHEGDAARRRFIMKLVGKTFTVKPTNL